MTTIYYDDCDDQVFFFDLHDHKHRLIAIADKDVEIKKLVDIVRFSPNFNVPIDGVNMNMSEEGDVEISDMTAMNYFSPTAPCSKMLQLESDLEELDETVAEVVAQLQKITALLLGKSTEEPAGTAPIHA